MTIREMFQKIEKAGFADVEMTGLDDGLFVNESFENPSVIVQKTIIPNRHSVNYILNLITGDQRVEELKSNGEEDLEIVGVAYLDYGDDP